MHRFGLSLSFIDPVGADVVCARTYNIEAHTSSMTVEIPARDLYKCADFRIKINISAGVKLSVR